MKVKLNGCEIYYEVHGNPEGETIFFIHGGPGMSDCRGDVKSFSALGDDYQLVFMDNRGSGRSEAVTPYTHKQWVDDIDALRQHLGLEKIRILGGSYGGFLTLEYVLAYPEHVTHVILRDTAANNRHNDLSMQKALDSNLPGINEEMLHRLFEGKVASNEEFREMIQAILPLYTVSFNEEKAKEKLDSIFFHYETHNFAFSENKKSYDVSGRLGEIKVPVLITVGIHDWVTPVEYSDELAARIPNNEYVKFENSGHSPQVEENDQYIELVRKFLKQEKLQTTN
ncbi:alpha/beta fold hydrolase [Alkalihalobacillus sp. AL-G]|uniref:alpha/beta fold hydrolase n=1 Tax=Alkalihalobacillus sp. AL-G TaxID=2926399 RepID=UPI00272A2780|nr:alpha/beta hydrolase [Alkalihalobacillus sp. AL-G]WLD93050.1 alpha/beta hydrolase [Alkalihalobacillus sp. AL-G]